MMSSSPETSTRTTGAHRAHREARDRAKRDRDAHDRDLHEGDVHEGDVHDREARDRDAYDRDAYDRGAYDREARGRAAHDRAPDRAHGRAAARTSARASAQRPPVRYEPYLDGLFTYCLSVLCDHDTATAALGDALAFAERRGRRGPDGPGDRRAWLYALARWSCLRRLAEAEQKRHGTHAPGRSQGTAADLPAAAREDRRRHELARLAWPEAAGTTPEQREALELAVRHQLAAHEVAAVLGMAPVAARELLAAAACEVERTRAAVAVVETGTCPGVFRLTGGNQSALSAALRSELVRHVDDCPRCRRTAERAVPGTWPGTSVTPAALPVLEAPRTALHTAMTHLPRARGGGPRFDRRGFPMDPKDHAARRDRLRARAVTTTVVATVVAAPVLAVWAAYRGAPLIGEGTEGRPAAASGAQDSEEGGGESPGYENTGKASERPGSRFTPRSGSSGVSVEVDGVAPGQGSGLSVAAGTSGDTTLITLTATGGSTVHWSAHTGASWLYLSRSSGALAAGESVTLKVYVDQLREPVGPWSARVAVAPAGAVVVIEGYGTAGSSEPSASPPRPSPSPSSSASPSPSPSASGPGPAPSGSGPSGPGPSGPEPTPSGPGPDDPEPEPPPGSSGGSGPPAGTGAGAGGGLGGSGEPSPSGG
ncbi:hypothetical protein [Streptomyces aurantiacus]|uniref:hypothetical protein n=1 Tax=Streptomyces aurantiacus TaxID=47760 RepID=UPI0006E396FD